MLMTAMAVTDMLAVEQLRLTAGVPWGAAVFCDAVPHAYAVQVVLRQHLLRQWLRSG